MLNMSKEQEIMSLSACKIDAFYNFSARISIWRHYPHGAKRASLCGASITGAPRNRRLSVMLKNVETLGDYLQ